MKVKVEVEIEVKVPTSTFTSILTSTTIEFYLFLVRINCLISPAKKNYYFTKSFNHPA